MTSLMTTPSGGEAQPRAKSSRKPSPAAETKAARMRAATGGEGGKPRRKRKRLADAKVPTAATFEFSVSNNKGRYGCDRWQSQVRIVSAEEWEAEKVESRFTWASKELEDGQVLLCRLVPPRPAAVHHDSFHEPDIAVAVKGFRSRLLDWIEAQPDFGDEPSVILEGEGACTVTIGVPCPKGGLEAVDVSLRHNRQLGPW